MTKLFLHVIVVNGNNQDKRSGKEHVRTASARIEERARFSRTRYDTAHERESRAHRVRKLLTHRARKG